MSFVNLKSFIEKLKESNELIQVDVHVSPDLQIAELTDRISKSKTLNKALLFTNNGTEFPLLINAFGSEKRICLALGVNSLDDISGRIQQLFSKLNSPKNGFIEKLKVIPVLNEVASWMPKSVKGRGKCQEIIMDTPDLSKLPVLKCWPFDGGKFITLPLVHTLDPENGTRNVGMYRMQIFDNKTTGMHWHLHKTGARHYREYKKRNIQKMPVAVALGGDPVYTYAATAPLPDGIDEYILAGFIRKKRVELVKCITQDIEVPSDCDIIIEGYVDTTEPMAWEGPFGDHTGFYSLEDWYPNFHVTCITHRKNAVYPATIVGIPPQEDAWIAKATERIFINPLKMTFAPEITDMALPEFGIAHNLSIVSIEKNYPGQAIKIANALWGAGQMMFNKYLVIVDQNIDVHNNQEVLKAIITNSLSKEKWFYGKGPLDILDHSSDHFAYGNKLCIDATSDIKNSSTNNINLPIEIDTSIEEIAEINQDLTKKGMPVIIISLKQEKTRSAFDIFKEIEAKLYNTTVVVFIDEGLPVSDYYLVAWYILSNTDPVRDIEIKDSSQKCLVTIDGTRKNKTINQFKRDWPSVVVSNIKTIEEINQIIDTHIKTIDCVSPSSRISYLGDKADGAKFAD